jgi:hypothetical protein
MGNGTVAHADWKQKRNPMSGVMKIFVSSSIFMTLAVHAFAGVTIVSPGNGSSVSSPFALSANAPNCSSQVVSVMGYSLDNNADSAFFTGTGLQAQVQASAGTHTVHVKAWTSNGAVCVTDAAITVTTSGQSGLVPSYATTNSNLEALANWSAIHDTGGSGNASGSTGLVTSPARDGVARRFSESFSASGDERFSASFGDDPAATNFFYDTWIYLNGTSQQISNIEMDMNQTIPNGKTVIFGFQCDGWNNAWDYARNVGGGGSPRTGWIHSGQPCNPRNWSINTWHHIQIAYSRDAVGNVTYHYVIFDGVSKPINATVYSAYALGWGDTLLTNFQLDGYGASGSNTVFVDSMSVSRW